MLSRSHPKLIARGAEVADADLKFKGAPSDDCDPFAIQNYIDRLASEVYDSIHGTQSHANKNQEEKDEWELMKQKAKRVPFEEVNLSIALKHGLMDEVKKENANRPFEKDNILTIMKVREEFIQDYPSANSFEYQWQIWVEWERYLKQIGVTIPQWGKVARKLIRLGVMRIQEDMTKKYSQISSGSNKRKASEEHVVPEKRKRGIPLQIDTRSCASVGFNHYISNTLENNQLGHDIANPFGSGGQFASISPSYSNSPFQSPFQSPFSTPQPSPYSSPVTYRQPVSPFGASLYNMIATQTPSAALFTPPASIPLPTGIIPPVVFDTLSYPPTSVQTQEYSPRSVQPQEYHITQPFVYSTSYHTVPQTQPTYTSSLSPSPIPSPSAPPSPSPLQSPSPSPSPSPSSVTSSPAYSPTTVCNSPSAVFISIHPDNIPVQLLDPPIHADGIRAVPTVPTDSL